ncbi:hypothetical protein [Thermocrispum municipale]|uniref:hypothetical protein n=1 Tax=Thermocrispum municipale TaxID=37926 RepID=UPI0004207D42|nr:hypothetical protein [Thermocrispum municipale]
MGREYNPDEIRTVASKVSQLSKKISEAGDGLTDAKGEGVFGKLPSSGSMAAALTKFTSGMRTEFAKGAEQASSTGSSLRKIAGQMDADEEEGVRTFSGQRVD